jgi:hypothetical protein
MAMLCFHQLEALAQSHCAERLLAQSRALSDVRLIG